MKAGAVCLLLAVFTWGAGCGYDPPPDILRSNPARGAIVADGAVPLAVDFTEPVEAASLEVVLASRKTDTEGRLLPWCGGEAPTEGGGCIQPWTGPCTPAGGCPGGVLQLDADGSGFSLVPDAVLAVGEYVLRIGAGLEDRAGNRTGVAYDLFFFVSPTGTMGPTTFEPGVILTWMELDEPFYFPMEVYWHVQVDPESGRVWGGACDGDLIDPDAERRYDHRDWQPVSNLEDEGFKFVFEGLVQDAQVQDAGGNPRQGWIFETRPFYIYASKPQVEAMDGRVSFAMVHDFATGRDVVRGLIEANEIYIFDTPAHANPSKASGSLYGYRMHPEEIGTGYHWQQCALDDPDTVTRP